MNRKITDINTGENASVGLFIPTDGDDITFNTNNDYHIDINDYHITPIHFDTGNSISFNIGKPLCDDKVVKQNFPHIDSNITEIVFENERPIHIHICKDVNVNFAGISNLCTITNHNIGPETENCDKKDYQIIIKSKLIHLNNLTFNNKISSFTIKYIPSDISLQLNIIKKAKIHLTTERVLANINQDDVKTTCNPKTIERDYNDLTRLARQNDKNFLMDYLVCKYHELPLPPEIMDIIGFYVNGEIKAFKMSNGCSISIESYIPVWYTGLIANNTDEI